MILIKTPHPGRMILRQNLDEPSLGGAKFSIIMVSVIVLGCICFRETRELILSHFLEPARLCIESVVANIDGEDY